MEFTWETWKHLLESILSTQSDIMVNQFFSNHIAMVGLIDGGGGSGGNLLYGGTLNSSTGIISPPLTQIRSMLG